MLPVIARAERKRLDRLSFALHAFHRYAHHPLCRAYEREVLTFGETRICRGCAYTAMGISVGAAAAAAVCGEIIDDRRTWIAAIAAVGALGVALLGSSLRARTPKAFTRWGASALLAFGLVGGLVTCVRTRGDTMAVAILLSLLAGSVAMYLAYRLRGPDRGPCISCPERAAKVCSGFRAIVRRERAFQRLASRHLRTLQG